MPETGQRICVVGTTGCGKTTLAAKLAELLNITHIELDALHWGANWTEPPPDVFREKVAQALSANAWVTDGNYGKARDITWNRADTLIWLDYPLPIIFWRLLRRTIKRTFTKETLWNNNTESIYNQFFTHDSLFYYAATTYKRRRWSFQKIIQEKQYPHLQVIIHSYPCQTRAWLKKVSTITQQNRIEHHDT
jgi:adenylate kinase family enzyme